MSGSGHRDGGLYERDEELGRIDELLDRAASGAGGVLAVEGPAGIGKSALLREAADRARARGLAVVSAAGSELERGFAFGVARRLLEGTLVRADRRRRTALLEGAARLGAPALGLEPAAAPAGAPGDAGYGAVHGIYWLTANLAAERPLAVVVDDLQWADAPSQRYLAYLARRVEGAPIALVVALRPALPGEDREAVDAILALAAGLRPAALSETAIAALGAELLGAPPSAALVRACHRATGGNALLVREVMAELRDRGIAPDAAAADAVPATGAERLGEAVRRRIAALSPDAEALAAAVSVLGDGCPPATAGALAGLDEERVAAGAATLAAADVLADGVPLRFRHPVIGAVVAEATPAVRRAAAHGRAARLVAEAGGPAAAVAAHLRLAPPAGDGWAVERLRASAREALAQGASREAAADLARALAEPPPSAVRVAVLRELGRAEVAAGLPDGPDHLRAALALERDPVDRARVALELADGLYERLRAAEAAEVARAALADLGDADRELALLLEVLVAECVRMDLGVGGDEPARLRARAEGLAGDTPAERVAVAAAAMMGGDDTAEAHAASAEGLQRLLDRGPLPASADTGIVSSLIRAGRLETAEALIEAKLAEARAGGLVHRFALMAGMRGWLAFERGALADAEADLAAATDLAAELALRTGPFAGLLAQALAEQGRFEEADAALEAVGAAGDLPEHQVMNPLLFARARARLAQGRDDAALADALEVGRRYERLGIRRAVPAWRSLAAALLARRGEREDARALAYEELGLAERWGTPLALGLAWGGIGLASGEAAALEVAADHLGRSPNRLEHARALVDLGAALRRAGRRADARAPLGRGMDIAHACGAAPLADRARQELRAAGARPRRLALTGAQSLTAAERRVAELAARGLTNRAIAEELFVTTATVETHLRHAFRKLGIGGREEIAAALSSGEEGEKIRVGP